MLKNLKNKRGFSLAELLVVIGMLVIMSSAAILSVAVIQNRYQQIARENNAQIIYQSAQENITELKKNGTWNELLEEHKTDMSFFGNKINEKPSDYDYWLNHSFVTGEAPSNLSYDKVKDDLYYFSSIDTEIMKFLLPLGSPADDLSREGEFFVEYNVKTASIYGVWYTDNKNIAEYEADIEGNLNMTARPSDSIDSKDASRARKNYKKDGQKVPYGYHGGGIINKAVLVDLQTPQLKIINGEDLVLQIKDNNCGSSIGLSNDVLTVSITGKTSGKSIVYTLNRLGTEYLLKSSNPVKTIKNVTANISSDNIIYNVVLDSISAPISTPSEELANKNLHFANVCPGFTPGEDIKITVTASLSDDSATPKSKTIETNSLYNKVDGNNYYISQMRHLENIDKEISGNNITDANIHFLKNISFDGQGTNLKHTKDYTSEVITKTDGTATVFGGGNYIPVNVSGNLTVDNMSANSAAIIYNIKIDTTASLTDSGVGLFGVVGTDNSNTVSISNIGVVSDTVVNDNVKTVFKVNLIDNAGALIGRGYGITTINNCFSTVQICELNGDMSSNIGGLVGSGETVNITNSYVGGVLGKDTRVAENTFSPYFSNLYSANSSSGSSGSSTKIGGLVGYAATANINNSYATVSIGAEEAPGIVYMGGLVGYSDNADIQNSYFAGALNALGDYREKMLMGGLANGNVTTSGSWYLDNCVTTSIFHYLDNTMGTYVSFDSMLIESSVNAIPYTRTDNISYNLPDVTGLGHHYGDWGKISSNTEYQIPAYALEGTLSKNALTNFLSETYDNFGLTEIYFVSTGGSRMKGNDGSGQEAAKDVSEEDTGSVLAWHDGSRVYISCLLKDKEIVAPNDCSYLLSIGYTLGWPATVSYVDFTNLNTENVTNMSYMLHRLGYSVNEFSIVGASDFDVSKVTDMTSLFCETGYSANSWSIGDLSKWQTSSVANMRSIFNKAGYSASAFVIGDIGKWDISNVTDLSYAFSDAGQKASTWYVGDLGNWNVSKVESIRCMFQYAATNTQTLSIGDLGRWNTYNVSDMASVFSNFGKNVTNFYIGNLGKWNTSNVTKMDQMFYNTGNKSSSFSLGELHSWVTYGVTDMANMFNGAGYNADYYIDLSTWNVTNVTSYSGFNYGVTTKIIAPIWVN